MSTIAVTGSSGFLGSHLVQALLKMGHFVYEIDFTTGFDLTNLSSIENIPRFDIIIHLAARSFVPLSFELPMMFYRDNYLSTLHTLELARKHKAKVIYFSSYLYGNPNYLPIDEKHPLFPHNPYAQSKMICEKLCEGYNRDFTVPVIIFRPFNIYGQNQNASFLIPSIVNQLKTCEIALKDPRPKRDFIFVLDVIDAVTHAIEYDKTCFEIFNLGFGKSYSIREIVAIIQEVSGLFPKVTFSNEIRKEEVLDTVADISKLYKYLNWKPKIDFWDGIKMMKIS